MIDSLSEHIGALYGKFSSWRLVGEEIAWEAADRNLIGNVNGHVAQYGALANAVYRGAAKDSPTLRRALGLPPKAVEVPPCPDCGQLHEQKATCPHDLERQRRGPRPHRRAAYFGAGEEGRELAEQWDEMAKQWGGMTGLARGLLKGRYIVEEVGE